MIGMSACLFGKVTTYKGTHNYVDAVSKMNPALIVTICPEVAGGLSIPRPPAEIVSYNPLKVINNKGEDVTLQYLEGSKKCLDKLKKHHVKVVLLKKNSPSCGNDGVYDGTFSKQLIEGQGVFAKMCEMEGIKVFNENQLEDFFEYLDLSCIQYK